MKSPKQRCCKESDSQYICNYRTYNQRETTTVNRTRSKQRMVVLLRPQNDQSVSTDGSMRGGREVTVSHLSASIARQAQFFVIALSSQILRP